MRLGRSNWLPWLPGGVCSSVQGPGAAVAQMDDCHTRALRSLGKVKVQLLLGGGVACRSMRGCQREPVMCAMCV